MPSVSEIWRRATSSPRPVRHPIRIPDDHVESGGPTPLAAGPDRTEEIVAQKDYVLVVLNQMFLSESRKWFTDIEPVVFASTEFLYNGRLRADPILIGPSRDDNLPAGTVIRNMIVCGPHPYRGGSFTFTLVLSRLPVGNSARDVLQLVEAMSGVLSPALGLSAYASVGGVVLDGVERLMNLDGLHPLIGLRETVNPDAGPPLQPGRWALIDADQPDPAQFWAIGDMLMKGATRAEAKPYREADFILYQIARAPDGRRSDVDALPIHALWMAALEAAAKPTGWDEAKANFAAMVSAVSTSPDLTVDQGRALIAERRAQLVALHEDVERNTLLSGGAGEGTAIQAEISDILSLR